MYGGGKRLQETPRQRRMLAPRPVRPLTVCRGANRRSALTLETLMSILTLILKRRSVSRYTCHLELESNRFAFDATLTDAFSVVTHLMIRFDTSFRYLRRFTVVEVEGLEFHGLIEM